jgi:hypothetical protein
MSHTGNPVSEKNSSMKPGDRARFPTPRCRIGRCMRVYASEFPRRALLGDSVNNGMLLSKSKLK